MKAQNVLAKRINTVADMNSYDKACKQILSNKIILAWIMKHILEEYSDYEIEEIANNYIEGEPEISKEAVHRDEEAEFIEGMNSEDTSLKESIVTFDIRFKAITPSSHTISDMIINVEAQSNFYPGYPIVKRGIYYAGRMISAQYGTEFEKSHYEKLKKVNSIWICTKPPKYRQNTIVSYDLKEKNIYGTYKENKNNYDMISVVLICLGNGSKQSDDELIKMLSVLLSRDIIPETKKEILQNEFGINMTSKIESEVADVCNLSQGLVDEVKIEDIKNLMESTGWDIDKCMDVLKVPTEPEYIREYYKEDILDTENI